MKKILCLLFILITPLLFCGCRTDENLIDNGGYERFKYIHYSSSIIYIDKETKVMYIFVKIADGAGLTVLVNADGTPMLWEGELE